MNSTLSVLGFRLDPSIVNHKLLLDKSETILSPADAKKLLERYKASHTDPGEYLLGDGVNHGSTFFYLNSQNPPYKGYDKLIEYIEDGSVLCCLDKNNELFLFVVKDIFNS